MRNFVMHKIVELRSNELRSWKLTPTRDSSQELKTQFKAQNSNDANLQFMWNEFLLIKLNIFFWSTLTLKLNNRLFPIFKMYINSILFWVERKVGFCLSRLLSLCAIDKDRPHDPQYYQFIRYFDILDIQPYAITSNLLTQIWPSKAWPKSL